MRARGDGLLHGPGDAGDRVVGLGRRAAGRRRRPAPGGRRPRRLGDTIRAYVALTKPRIIELLLVTTVPAMVLAARDVPGMQLGEWTWLVVWTLVGGSLAAGSANAINCYLDRDIDELMARTRRRPLPAHQVEPERAVVFGLVLGVISLVVMAWFVNLVAAFLTLLAIAFYVVVYTILLKRSTPQNIVIGGAAGALPPVIGWAAVTGSVAPAGDRPVRDRLLLDAAPLLGAVAPDPQGLRGRPASRCCRSCGASRRRRSRSRSTRSCSWRSRSSCSRSPGWARSTSPRRSSSGRSSSGRPTGCGAKASSEERSTAGAIRLYRYSITYLTLLFAAVAVDALLTIPLG